ncbi:MAG: polysaccharide deacetylase family protein [Bdellovibrionales bacterium]|nr:polysaccharide deacetylase family protein [Bdellovibrionales bacterium]
MNILHVLSQLQPTGAEFYAVALAEWQKEQGHQVFIISDNLFVSTEISFIPYPIGNRKLGQRIRNIAFLKKVIAESQIDVVHAHSRAASWVANRALKGQLVPLVSTIHGRQHVHSSSVRKNIYGQQLMAVCENIRQHLIHELYLPEKIIVTLPNCLKQALSENAVTSSSAVKVISLIGRTTGPKGESASDLIESVFPKLLKKFKGSLKIKIIGGDVGHLRQEAQKQLKSCAVDIECLGFVRELRERILESDVVIASGRSAMESLQLGKTVFALGEANYEGLVGKDSWERCVASNFGDVAASFEARNLDLDQIYRDLENWISDPKPSSVGEEIAARVHSFYSLDRIGNAVFDVYKKAKAYKAMPYHIPALMYHKVPKKVPQTRHMTYILKDRLESHFRFLRFFGFTPLTFKEYLAFFEGEKPWSLFPKKPVFITFDDGYKDNYENILPLLKKYQFKIVLFCLADENLKINSWDLGDGFEEESLLMSFSEMSSFLSQGSEIGSHGLRHKDLVRLASEKGLGMVKDELALSRQILTEQLDTEIVTFAYPFGRSTEAIRQAVEQEGYKFGVSTDSGGQHLEEDHFHIFRVNIFPNDGWMSLLKKTSFKYRKRFYRTRGR